MKAKAMKRPATPHARFLKAALVLSILLLACRDGAGAGIPEGGKLDFRLKSVDGRVLGPRDFRGQVVVVDFWATWCIPCHLQAKILAPLHQEYKGKGVQFLAANVGEEEATVRSFLKDKPFPYPVLLDPEDRVSSQLGVDALPTLLVLDKKGQVSFFHVGLLADKAMLRKIIKEAGA